MLFSEVIVCVNTNGTVVLFVALLSTFSLYRVGINSAPKLSVIIIVLYCSIASLSEEFTKPCDAISFLFITLQLLFSLRHCFAD